jgi:hypothetical protein
LTFEERIGHESGEYFERYVEAIFKFAGFVTERDRHFHAREGAVIHEIDIIAEADFGSVAVECKDWSYMGVAQLKKELDAFATKVRQVGATTGVFAINLQDDGRYQRYRDYMKSEGLSFWDSRDIERWYDRVSRHKDKLSYQKELCNSIGIQAQPQTKTDKVFGLLKKTGVASLTVARVGRKVLHDLQEEPPKRRDKRAKRKASFG